MKELSVTDVQKGLRLLANEGHDLAHGPDMIRLHGKPYFSMYNNIRKSPNTDNWHGMSNIPLGENGAIAHISTHTDGTDSMYILGVPHAELDEHGQMHPGYGGSFYHAPSTSLPWNLNGSFSPPKEIVWSKKGEIKPFMSRHSDKNITNVHELLADWAKMPSVGSIKLPDGSTRFMTQDEFREHRRLADPRLFVD